MGVASTLKGSSVKVSADLYKPLPHHLIIDHDYAQHKGREELGIPFPSSANYLAVMFATSDSTYILYPTESCGLSEVHRQALKIPLPPYADLVVHNGDIP